jgi:16S rRNA (cytidine1402-2'-O)-methyltransferase
MVSVTLTASPLPAGLYLVATPIGNLRDITLRALEVLMSVNRILAEDTRVSAKLLRHYGIETPMTPCHDHNMAAMAARVVADIGIGHSFALISDAGTPLISDPGYPLVQAAIDAGVPVIPIPGPSAVITALAVGGLPTDCFTFAGFMPSGTGARQKRFAELASVPGTLVVYESPNRLVASLTDALTTLGDRPAAVARELTKTFEECRRGHLSELIAHYTRTPPKGEIAILIGSGTAVVWDDAAVDAALREHLTRMGPSDAAAAVAKLSGVPKKVLYQKTLTLK